MGASVWIRSTQDFLSDSRRACVPEQEEGYPQGYQACQHLFEAGRRKNSRFRVISANGSGYHCIIAQDRNSKIHGPRNAASGHVLTQMRRVEFWNPVYWDDGWRSSTSQMYNFWIDERESVGRDNTFNNLLVPRLQGHVKIYFRDQLEGPDINRLAARAPRFQQHLQEVFLRLNRW